MRETKENNTQKYRCNESKEKLQGKRFDSPNKASTMSRKKKRKNTNYFFKNGKTNYLG